MAKTKKQLQIAGTEKKSIKDVDAAAEAYFEPRNERMDLTRVEVEKQAALLAAMKKHGLTEYTDEDADPPLLVTIETAGEKAKVRKITEDEEAA